MKHFVQLAFSFFFSVFFFIVAQRTDSSAALSRGKNITGGGTCEAVLQQSWIFLFEVNNYLLIDFFCCSGGMLQLRICGMHHLKFGHVSFVVGCFPDLLLYSCSCLTASGVGLAGHFRLFGETNFSE